MRLIHLCRRPAFWGAVTASIAPLPLLGQEASFSRLPDLGTAPGLLSPHPGLSWGRFNFHGGLSGSVAYDDLVAVDANNKPESDLFWTVSPFASVEALGPYNSIRAMYQPTLLFFADHPTYDTLNHNGSFSFLYPLNRLTLSLSQTALLYSTFVRDIGNRATEQTYSTVFSATYDWSDRTSFEGSVTYDRYDYGTEFISSQDFGQQLWADYHFRPSISLGAGVSVSEMEVENGGLQTAESPSLRVNYRPMPQLSFSGTVGLEFRQFGSGGQSSVEPILRANGSYTFRTDTTFTITAERSQYASGIYAGQNFVNTSFSAGVRHDFFHRFSANLTGGITSANYISAETGVASQRTDTYYFLRTEVDVILLGKWSSGLFYEHLANDSNAGQFNYDQNIVGLRLGWQF